MIFPDIQQGKNTKHTSLQKSAAGLIGFEKRLRDEAERPLQIRQQLTEARQQQKEIDTQLELPPPADEGPVTAESRRWVLEPRDQALGAEIEMLEQELLSQPVRVDLLKAQRDESTVSAERASARIKILDDLVNRRRQAEAETVRARAEASRRQAEGMHPLVIRLAEENAQLSEEIAALASVLDERAARRRARISWRARSTKTSRAQGKPSRWAV